MTALIPLRARDGSIRAHAIVDDEDFIHVGAYRWHMVADGYVRRMSSAPQGCPRPVIQLHRELLGLQRGDPREGDHINGNPLDNRRANLRIVTRAQNAQNVGAQKRGRSSHRGVVFHRLAGLWQARVKLNGRFHSAGYFKNEHDAGRAASELRSRLLPFSNETRHNRGEGV